MQRKKQDEQSKIREYEESLIEEIINDFSRRREERIKYERQWELNRNFLNGNQYCDINRRGDIVADEKTFFWQNRGVFNHIAPIVESRLARFSRISPTVYVRPRSDDDKDVTSADVAEKLIAEVFKNADVESAVRKATAWSETCGTSFYKVIWDENGGEKIADVEGVSVYEGDVKIMPLSPFEIFPDNLEEESVAEQKSIIHARPMSIMEIYARYGVMVEGEEINTNLYSVDKKVLGTNKEKSSNQAIVIERYERPREDLPQGRLVTVAGGKLLQVQPLPYVNGKKGERTYPFIKQDCITVSGSFFSSSIVERLIPVQRAFNAVKNRKHEFLNRLSMGVMTVEDGSVDVDDLASDGLSPGKVLVYRQGAKAPEMMKDVTMPSEFNEEEDKLINEFVIISGVSDVSSSSENATITSGSALEILVEQDNSRLLTTAESIRRCYLEIARQTIRLYAQFMADIKAIKYQDSFNKTRVYYADKKATASDDVYVENANELLYSDSQKKELLLKLYNSGLLADENGVLRATVKEKVLTLLGYTDLDYRKGLSRLQEEKALNENDKIRKYGLPTDEVDDHSIHLDEHVRYILSEFNTLNDQEKQRLYQHVKEHKQKLENEEKSKNERTN